MNWLRSGFEPWTFGVRSHRSANCDAAIDLMGRVNIENVLMKESRIKRSKFEADLMEGLKMRYLGDGLGLVVMGGESCSEGMDSNPSTVSWMDIFHTIFN